MKNSFNSIFIEIRLIFFFLSTSYSVLSVHVEMHMCLGEIMFVPQFHFVLLSNKQNIKIFDSIILLLYYANELQAVVDITIVIYCHQIIIEILPWPAVANISVTKFCSQEARVDKWLTPLMAAPRVQRLNAVLVGKKICFCKFAHFNLKCIIRIYCIRIVREIWNHENVN